MATACRRNITSSSPIIISACSPTRELRQEETRQRRDGPQDGTERPRYEEPRSGSGYDYDYGDEHGGDEQPQPPAREARGEERRSVADTTRTPTATAATTIATANRATAIPTSQPKTRSFATIAAHAAPQGRAVRAARAVMTSQTSPAAKNLLSAPKRASSLRCCRPRSASQAMSSPMKPRPSPAAATRKPRDTDGNDESLEAVG